MVRHAPRARHTPALAAPIVVAGVDLAGSERRRTGFCLLTADGRTSTSVLGSDEEILAAVRAASPGVVSIDAPLFLPAGRPSIETRGPPHLRASDRILLTLGIRFFPITLGPMRTLTARGMRLRETLETEGFRTIEGYPGAGQDLLGIPRKGEGVDRLRAGLVRSGLTGDIERPETTHDELDAASAAYLGERYLAGDFVAIGDPKEGWMILAPKAAVLARFRARAAVHPRKKPSGGRKTP
jgi:predicted nuclease with RNAse H fold